MHNDVISASTGHQLGINYLTGVINIIGYVNAKFILEICYSVRIYIVGPVVDIELFWRSYCSIDEILFRGYSK